MLLIFDINLFSCKTYDKYAGYHNLNMFFFNEGSFSPHILHRGVLLYPEYLSEFTIIRIDNNSKNYYYSYSSITCSYSCESKFYF